MGLDTRIITNYIRDKGAPKGIIEFSKDGKHNIDKLLKKCKSWNGLLGLRLLLKKLLAKMFIIGPLLNHGTKKVVIKKIKKTNTK